MNSLFLYFFISLYFFLLNVWYFLIMTFKHIPTESTKHYLREWIFEFWFNLIPCRFHQLGCLFNTCIKSSALFQFLNYRRDDYWIIWFGLKRFPNPLSFFKKKSWHSFCNREGNSAISNILSPNFKFSFKSTQVENIIDNLECKSDRFEELEMVN